MPSNPKPWPPTANPQTPGADARTTRARAARCQQPRHRQRDVRAPEDQPGVAALPRSSAPRKKQQPQVRLHSGWPWYVCVCMYVCMFVCMYVLYAKNIMMFLCMYHIPKTYLRLKKWLSEELKYCQQCAHWTCTATGATTRKVTSTQDGVGTIVRTYVRVCVRMYVCMNVKGHPHPGWLWYVCMYILLHLECRFFNLKSQSTI